MRATHAAVVAVVLGAFAASSCSKEPPSPPVPGAGLKVVVLKVDGMQRGEGGKT